MLNRFALIRIRRRPTIISYHKTAAAAHKKRLKLYKSSTRTKIGILGPRGLVSSFRRRPKR